MTKLPVQGCLLVVNDQRQFRQYCQAANICSLPTQCQCTMERVSTQIIVLFDLTKHLNRIRFYGENTTPCQITIPTTSWIWVPFSFFIKQNARKTAHRILNLLLYPTLILNYLVAHTTKVRTWYSKCSTCIVEQQVHTTQYLQVCNRHVDIYHYVVYTILTSLRYAKKGNN